MAKKMTTKQKLEVIKNDFTLFAKNFIKIIDNNGDTVPFELNPEQSNYIDEMGKYNIILKGRQIGFTTLSLAYMIYSACIKPDTSYMILTQHQSVSKSLFVRIKKMYKSLPHKQFPDFFPKQLLNNRDELYLDNGSRIVIATAGGEDAISGNTFQFIHLSEMAKYPDNVQEEILSTCIPALAKNDSSMIWIESTAMGYNYYQSLFLKSWRSKESTWKAFFYSWLAEAYTKQFKQSFDEAEKWFRLHNGGSRMTAKDLEHDEKVLKEKYGANYRQLMFRRYYIETNSLEKFQREFPTTPETAFQSSNQSVFDTNKIIEQMQIVVNPIGTNDLELPDILKQYINKQLFIYHEPKRNKRYYGGVDVASGSGNDYSTISIFDEDGQQVASFYDNKVPVYKFAEIVNELDRYFSYAFLCIERNNVGIVLLEKLRKQHHYMNLYKQKIFQDGKKKLQLGWQLTKANKSILIENFKEQFELGMINIECIETLEQMKIFIDDNGKMGNKKGKENHDDLVIACAYMVQAMKSGKWYV